MIEFKNGKFSGGSLLGQVYLGIDEATSYDLWDNPISDDCWAFTISDDLGVGLFNVVDYGISFIPKELDTSNEYHNIFWCTELTLVFDSLYLALNYMRNYKGEFKDIIFGAYLLYEKEQSIEEIMDKYMTIDNLTEDSDKAFYHELSKFIISKNLSVKTTLATMKSFILDCYRDEIVDQKLINPN